MRRLLREPLVHFLLAALFVFALDRLVNVRRDDADRTIFVSQADLQRLAALYATQAGAPPSDQQIETLVYDHVRQIALAREARRRGLDIDDVVVERRLAQKMGFMISDLAEPSEPDDETLRAWLAAHPERFVRPELSTFEHVYFPAGQEAVAEAALASLRADPSLDWRMLGAPFMLRNAYVDLTDLEIRRVFGAAFAADVSNLSESDGWTGPVASSLGLHLVRVVARTPSATPDLDSARSDVRADWLEEMRRAANAESETDILKMYSIEIEGAGG